MTEQRKKSGKGCLFWGGIVFSILLGVVLLFAYLGYRYARGLVEEYTDTKPLTLPATTLSQGQMDQLHQRIEQFSSAVRAGNARGPLTLTSEEVNALISSGPGAADWSGRVHVRLVESNVQAQVSIPAEQLGLRPLRGRYLNGSAVISTRLSDGQLQIGIVSLSANGKPFPETLMRHVRAQNFARQLNQDPEASSALGKLEGIRIENDKLVIDPK